MFYISTIREGGAARVMSNLANQFVQDKNEVLFVTNFPALVEYPLDLSIKRFNIETSESQASFLSKNYRRVSELRKLLKKEKPDILVSFMHENDGRALVAAKITGTKVLLSVRNDPEQLFKSKFKKCVVKYIYSNATGVVFQTRAAQKWFPNKIQSRSRIIFNPVNPVFYDTVRNPKENTIVTCGRLTKQKNHIMLIQAIGIVKKTVPNVCLKIYGDGALKKDLQDEIDKLGLSDNVALMGTTNDVKSVLSTADIFVMSSDYEGLPNALMEAMAVGVPCISTDCPCGGPRDLFDGKFDYLLTTCGDANEMANTINDIIQDRQREQIGMRLRQRALEFSPDKIYDEWNSYISELISSKL